MSYTTAENQTHQKILNSGEPAETLASLKAIKFGNAQTVIKATFTGLNAAATDITTAASKAAATVAGIELRTGENLPAIGRVVTLRVTGGTAAAGPRIVVDSSGTAATAGSGAVGVATISDDGKTLTFEGAATGFVLTYTPRAAVSLTAAVAGAAPTP